MANAGYDVILATFPDREAAVRIANHISAMHANGIVSVADAAILARSEYGRVSAAAATGISDRGSSFLASGIVGLLELVFSMSVPGTPVTGAIVDALQQSGIDEERLREMGTKFESSNSGIVLLVEWRWADRIIRFLDGQGDVLRHALTASAVVALGIEPADARRS